MRRVGYGLVTLLVLAALLLAAAAVVRRFPDSYPTGDAASLSLYTQAALVEGVLVGPYSLHGWNHPGPMLFYVLAPLYYLTGQHEMSHRVTALLINVAAAVTMLLIARRLAGRLFTVLTAAAILLIVGRAGGDMAFSAWNPHVTLFPFAAMLYVGAAAATGVVPAALLLIILSSFIVQSHVGFALPAVVVSVAALGAGYMTADRKQRTYLVAAWAAVGLLLWLPPIWEQISNSPGNFRRTVDFFLSEQRPTPSLGRASRWFYTYYLLPFSPDMRLPLGWRAVASSSRMVAAAGLGVLLMLPIAAFIAYRRKNLFLAAFGVMCAIVSIVGLFSTAAIRGTVMDHYVFWLCIPGMYSVAAVIAAFLQPLEGLRLLRPAVACAYVLAGAGCVNTANRLASWQHDAAPANAPLVLYSGLRSYTSANAIRRPVLEMTDHTWAEGVGMVLQAGKHHDRIAVPADFVRLVGDRYAKRGYEKGRFLLYDLDVDQNLPQVLNRQPIVRTDRFAIIRLPE